MGRGASGSRGLGRRGEGRRGPVAVPGPPPFLLCQGGCSRILTILLVSVVFVLPMFHVVVLDFFNMFSLDPMVLYFDLDDFFQVSGPAQRRT